MSKKDEGGPAFPMPGGSGDFTVQVSHLGMTLRDYFAAQAMVGLLAAHDWRSMTDTSAFAKDAFAIADAMLEARK